MEAQKDQSFMLSKLYGDYKLTVFYTITSIILAIESLNGESKFRNEYFNDGLSAETKRTFGNIENLYKYLKSNIQDSDVVNIEAPGRVIVAYFYEDDNVIKSKYLTYNLSVKKPKSLQIKDLEQLSGSQFEELKEQKIRTSQIKKRQQDAKKDNQLFRVQISSLVDQNNALKQKIAAIQMKYAKDLQALQRNFDKKIIQVYQLIQQSHEHNPIKSQIMPKQYKQKAASDIKLTEERIRFLELQLESLRNHPLLVCSKCIIKQSKNILAAAKKFCDNKFEIYVKPSIQKYGNKVSKVAYYGFIGAAQLFALLIAFLTIWYVICPIFDFIF